MSNRNVYDILAERGFLEQSTHDEQIKAMLANESVTFYIGFDPTADSLTAGHFITVMAMSHMQRAGHRPVVLVGGGTGFVGDPTDKSDLRKMMTPEEIQHNVDCFKKQLSAFIKFEDEGGNGILVDNADWLLKLQYVPFIREYGVHFSVNKMLTADCYRTRFERGLTFFEFNYMLMQSYDFLELYRRYNCKLQMGGNDQWSNILGGVELIRRVENKDAYGLTLSLLTTSEGVKMGKSQKGAVWLDPAKTTPYEFFQYWRNVDDRDVIRCIKLLTFLPMEQINEMATYEGSEINKAKEALAFEVTKIVHGEEEATKALAATKRLFGGGGEGGDDATPTTEIEADRIKAGINVIELLEHAKLIASRSEGRRLVQQGGIKLGENKITAFDYTVTENDFADGSLMIQKGKKVYHKIVMK